MIQHSEFTSGELRSRARAAWAQSDPAAKVQACLALAREGGGVINPDAMFAPDLDPGRPALPRCVPPVQVPTRGLGRPEGRVALLHALAHIEFNAINLALDAAWRFSGLPRDYYRDWVGVAAEEALHFCLLKDELTRRGAWYGQFDAHDGLWSMAVRTAGDVLARMALVPRLLEARGLDVTPGLQRRLAQAGDTAAVAILQRILDDEVGHVAIGNRWYRHVCASRGLDPVASWSGLVRAHGVEGPKPPFNVEARLRAGFDAAEIPA